ncbi:MAG TPA: protein phosphatase 2C domain-containing protein, partial [Polyangiaceae bacterium]|nr:protein phosphatase 2C domain-containing protein [Polyangiaceae bacterium]
MQGALLEVAQRTDPGRDPDKQINEDSAAYRATKLGHLLIVCDGMGGHALGQEASRLAVTTIMQSVESAAAGTAPGTALAHAIAEAGRRVYQMGGAGPQAGRPGSTCVALLVHGGAVEVAHVGDSRAYFVRNGRIWPLTKDHSVVQQLLDQGAITPEQAVLHPEGNKITRALGMKPDTEVELREPPLLQTVGDVFVLASDGLCDLVRTDEIGTVVMQAASLDLASQNLVAMANARGGHDNITVLLARVLPGGGAGGVVASEPLAPTIVEKPMGATAPGAPEKTLVDRPPMAPLSAAPPFAPTPAAAVLPPPATSGGPVSPTPAARPITEPLHAPPIAQGMQPRLAPAPPSHTIPPAPPSRSGLLVAVVAMMLVFLVAVVVWWILR